MKTRKLRLDREVLAELRTGDLAGVIGGVPYPSRAMYISCVVVVCLIPTNGPDC